jgi:hypothetical protein
MIPGIGVAGWGVGGRAVVLVALGGRGEHTGTVTLEWRLGVSFVFGHEQGCTPPTL